MSELTTTQKDKLMADLKVVIADAEELMKMTAGQVGEKAGELRQRMQVRMDQAKVDLARMQEAAVLRAKDAEPLDRDGRRRRRGPVAWPADQPPLNRP